MAEEKITSIAELKREAGMLLAQFTNSKGMDWKDEAWRQRVVEILEENIKNISEFEASVKKELKSTVDWLHNTNSLQAQWEARAVISELGNILGYNKVEIECLLFQTIRKNSAKFWARGEARWLR